MSTVYILKRMYFYYYFCVMRHSTYVQSLLHRWATTLIKMLGIVFCSCIFLSISESATKQNTTIHLEIIASFIWSLSHTWNTAILDSNIYWTTWAYHTVLLWSSKDATYTLHGNSMAWTTGIIYSWTQPTLAIQLTPWDWLKEVFVTYIPLTWISADQLTPPPVIYWVDTTPPPLTSSYAWPSATLDTDDSIPFTWNAVTDTWIWLDQYVIQLSYSPLFSTAMEFSTTGTSLLLWAWSLTPGNRYRRRAAIDILWNSIYGYPTNFTIRSSTPSWFSHGWNNSSIWGSWWAIWPNQPSPISDQCPWGDKSGNYFDGVCSLLTQSPVFMNVPKEHQASDVLPRWETIFNQVTEPKAMLYVFPNYDAPKPFTIYEHTPDYVYQDIYEYTDTVTTYPQLPYKPSFGVKTVNNNKADAPFTSKFAWISTSRVTNYLFYRFVQTTASCSDVGQFCPLDAVCREIWSVCYQDITICLETQTQNELRTQRCPRMS